MATPSVVSLEKSNVSLSFPKPGGGEDKSSNATSTTVSTSTGSTQNTIKGGLTLVFAPEVDTVDEECMEEKRARLPRYLKMMAAVTK